MLLLDTNMISELMRAAPAPAVLNWFDQQTTSLLFTSAMTVAEIMYGLENLPTSVRKESLKFHFNQVIETCFKHRVLFFDHRAALCYGELMAFRKRAGKPMRVIDGQICALALSHQIPLVTPNTRDFFDCGLILVNPFAP